MYSVLKYVIRLYPARKVRPSTGCQVRLMLASKFGTIRFSTHDRFDCVAWSSRMYLARSLTMSTRRAPVHSVPIPKAPATPEYMQTSWPTPTIGPYMRWDKVLMYRAAHSGDVVWCGGSPSGWFWNSNPLATVRHWNRSQNQENRPPAIAYDRAFSVSKTGNRPATSQLSNRWVNRMVMSVAPFQMPFRSPNTMSPVASVVRATGPVNSGAKLNTGANRKKFSRFCPALAKFGPWVPAPAEYLVSNRCSQLMEKFHPFSSR